MSGKKKRVVVYLDPAEAWALEKYRRRGRRSADVLLDAFHAFDGMHDGLIQEHRERGRRRRKGRT